MQVVIDTNIIVSALLNPSGSCYLFMNKVFVGCYDVVVSIKIISEYQDVLNHKKFCFSQEDIDFIIKWFIDNALFVEVDENCYSTDNVIDKKDLPFYTTARATKSKLVTGNIRHYPIEEMRTMIWELV